MFSFIKQTIHRHRIRTLAKQLLEFADNDEFYEKIQVMLEKKEENQDHIIVVKDNKTSNTFDDIINYKYDNFGYYNNKT